MAGTLFRGAKMGASAAKRGAKHLGAHNIKILNDVANVANNVAHGM